MQTQRVYIGIGSNLGDRVANMREAVLRLRAVMSIDAVSQLYAAAATGLLNDATFFSAVVCGQTTLPPFRLLTELQKIERTMGRRRVQDGLRSIDLDILFYGSAIIETRDLTVPHAQLPKRAFVLKPLAEIAPTLMHPVLYYTPLQLLQDAEDVEQVQVYQPPPYTTARQPEPVLELQHGA